MDRASPYPIRRDWAAQLWEHGIAQKLIQRLPSRGITAYRVDSASDTWATVVAQCANGGQQPDNLVVETFRATQTEADALLSIPDDE